MYYYSTPSPATIQRRFYRPCGFRRPAREWQHRSALCSEQRVPGWNTSPTSNASDDFGRIPLIPKCLIGGCMRWLLSHSTCFNVRRWAQMVNVQVTRVFSTWHETSLSARKLSKVRVKDSTFCWLKSCSMLLLPCVLSYGLNNVERIFLCQPKQWENSSARCHKDP